MPDKTETATEGMKVADKVKHGDYAGAVKEAQAYLKELQQRDPEHYKQQAKAFTDELIKDGGLPLLELEFGSPDNLKLGKLDRASLTSFEQSTTDPLAAALADALLSKWNVIESGAYGTDSKIAIDAYCESHKRQEIHDGATVMYDSGVPPKVTEIIYQNGTSIEFMYAADGKVTFQTDNPVLNALLVQAKDSQSLAVDNYGDITVKAANAIFTYQTDGSVVTKDVNGVITGIEVPGKTPVLAGDDVLARHFADELEQAFQKSGDDRAAALKLVNDEMMNFIVDQKDPSAAQKALFDKVTAQLALDGKLGSELFDTFAHQDVLQASINGNKYQGWYHGDTLSAYAATSAIGDNDFLAVVHRLLAAGFAKNFAAIDVAANGGGTDNMAGDGDLQAWKDKSEGRAAVELLLADMAQRRGVTLFDDLYHGREITKNEIQDCLTKDQALLTDKEIAALNFMLQHYDEIAGKNSGQLTEYALKVYATDRGSSSEIAAFYGDLVSGPSALIKGFNGSETFLTPDQQAQQAKAFRDWMAIDTIASLGAVDADKIIGALDGMTAAERASLEKAYEEKYHSSLRHDLKWRLGDKYADAASILDRPDGKADAASHIHIALTRLDAEFAPFRGYGYKIDNFSMNDAQKGALKDIRDTLSVLNSVQLAELRADYLRKYGISLEDALLKADDIPKSTVDTIKIYLDAGGTDKRVNDINIVDNLGKIALDAKDLRMFEEAFRGASPEARAAFKQKYGELAVKNAFPDCYDQLIALDYLNFGRAQLSTVAAQDTHWLHTNKEAIVTALENATDDERAMFKRGRDLAMNSDTSKLSGADLDAYNYYAKLHSALKNAAYDWEVDGWESKLLYKDSNFIKDFTSTHHDGALGSGIGSWTDSYAIQDVFRNMSKSDWELLTYKGVSGLNADDKAKYDLGEKALADARTGKKLSDAEQQLADFAKSVDDKTAQSSAFKFDIQHALLDIWMNDDDRARVMNIYNFKLNAATWEDANKCPDILDLFNLYKDKGFLGAYYRDHNKLIDGVLSMSDSEQKEYWQGKQLQASGRTDLNDQEKAMVSFAVALDDNVKNYLDNGAMKEAAQKYLFELASSKDGNMVPSNLVNFLHDAATGKSALTLSNDISSDTTGTIKLWAAQNKDMVTQILNSALDKSNIPSGISYSLDGTPLYPATDPRDEWRTKILGGTLGLADQLMLTNDKTEKLNAVERSSQSERDKLVSGQISLADMSIADAQLFKQIAKDVTLDDKQQPVLPQADTIRAYLLGYADEAQVRDLLSKDTPEQIVKLKAEYRIKFGGDLEADVLNKVDTKEQNQYLSWLHSTAVVALQDYMDKTGSLNNSYSFMDGFMRSSWDGTQNYAYQAADMYAASLKEFSAKFESLPPEIQKDLSQKLSDAIKAFKDSRGQMNEQLIDLAIMLGTMAVTMGGSALLEGTALTTRMAIFAAIGGVFKVLAKRAMDGTDAQMDINSVLRDAITGGMSGGFAAITPEDLLAALPETMIAKLTGGVVGKDIIAGLGERVTGLLGSDGQKILQEKIDHMILRAIATGEKIDASAAMKVIQEAIDKSPQLTKLVADNPGLKETITSTIATNLATKIDVGVADAIFNFAQKQLHGLAGGEAIVEISTTTSTAVNGFLAWDNNKTPGENISAIIAQVLEADKQALGTGLVFHFAMQGFGVAMQVGTAGAKYLGIIKPGEPLVPSNLIVTYEDGTQRIITPGQEIPDLAKVKDVASVPEVQAQPKTAATSGDSGNGSNPAIDTVISQVADPTLKANVQKGMAELPSPAQKLIADNNVVVQPIKGIADIDPKLLDEVVPGKGGKTLRQMLEDPTEGGAFYDPKSNKIYLMPNASPDAIEEELWHAVNKGLKDFAGSKAMDRAIVADQTLDEKSGIDPGDYFNPKKNEQANQEIFQKSARILEKIEKGETLTDAEKAFQTAHPNALEVTAERLYMQGILKKGPWELLETSPATKDNPHPNIDGDFKSGKDFTVPPDAIGNPEKLVPVAADKSKLTDDGVPVGVNPSDQPLSDVSPSNDSVLRSRDGKEFFPGFLDDQGFWFRRRISEDFTEAQLSEAGQALEKLPYQLSKREVIADFVSKFKSTLESIQNDSPELKLKKLQETLDQFTSENGLPPVKIEMVDGMGTRGAYGDGVLALRSDLLSDPYELMRTVLHETLHSEQQYLLTRRIADELKIGVNYTDAQFDAFKAEYEKRMGFQPDDEYLKAALKQRDGKQLSVEQSGLADEMIKSFRNAVVPDKDSLDSFQAMYRANSALISEIETQPGGAATAKQFILENETEFEKLGYSKETIRSWNDVMAKQKAIELLTDWNQQILTFHREDYSGYLNNPHEWDAQFIGILADQAYGHSDSWANSIDVVMDHSVKVFDKATNQLLRVRTDEGVTQYVYENGALSKIVLADGLTLTRTANGWDAEAIGQPKRSLRVSIEVNNSDGAIKVTNLDAPDEFTVLRPDGPTFSSDPTSKYFIGEKQPDGLYKTESGSGVIWRDEFGRVVETKGAKGGDVKFEYGVDGKVSSVVVDGKNYVTSDGVHWNLKSGDPPVLTPVSKTFDVDLNGRLWTTTLTESGQPGQTLVSYPDGRYDIHTQTEVKSFDANDDLLKTTTKLSDGSIKVTKGDSITITRPDGHVENYDSKSNWLFTTFVRSDGALEKTYPGGSELDFGKNGIKQFFDEKGHWLQTVISGSDKTQILYADGTTQLQYPDGTLQAFDKNHALQWTRNPQLKNGTFTVAYPDGSVEYYDGTGKQIGKTEFEFRSKSVPDIAIATDAQAITQVTNLNTSKDILANGKLTVGSPMQGGEINKEGLFRGTVLGPDGKAIDVVIHLMPEGQVGDIAASRLRKELVAQVLDANLFDCFPATASRKVTVDGVTYDAWVQVAPGGDFDLGIRAEASKILGITNPSDSQVAGLLNDPAHPEFRKAYEEAQVERLIFGDFDNHSGNNLWGDQGKVFNIDLDTAFSVSSKYDLFVGDAKGINQDLLLTMSEKTLLPSTLERVQKFVNQFDTAYGRSYLQSLGLSPQQVDATLARARALLDSGKFPPVYYKKSSVLPKR